MRKTRIRVRITILVGIILLVSNSLLVGLLSYNFNVALKGFEVPINGTLVAYYFDVTLRATGQQVLLRTNYSHTTLRLNRLTISLS